MPAISTRHIQVNFLQSLLGFYLAFRGLTTAAVASRAWPAPTVALANTTCRSGPCPRLPLGIYR